MQVETGVSGQPRGGGRRLVGGVVVADQVHVEVGRYLLVQPGQELGELDRAVAAVDRADHRAGGHVEGGEQGGDAVADVVVGAPLGHARHHRQDRCTAVQRLDLRLLVHRENQRLLRRIQIQPDNVADLVDELRIVAELKGVHQMRLEPERLPHPPDRRARQPGLGRHRRPRPVGRIRRSRLQRRHDHLLDLIVGDPARRARPRLIGQALQPPVQETPAPLGHRLRPDTHLHGNVLIGPQAILLRTAQHDPAPQGQRLRRLRPPRPTHQRHAFLIGQHQRHLRTTTTSHAATLH